MSRELTEEEDAAIRSLRRLAKRWPASLKLFGWSGSLYVMDAEMEAGDAAVLADIGGISCDGGDP